MAISVLCTGCGKQLNVKDELVGRRIKCPQCQATFLAEPTAAVSTPIAPSFQGKRSLGTPLGLQKTPMLHVSPKAIVLASAAVILPTMFFLWRIGPAAVQDAWAKQAPSAEIEVKDVVDRIIQSHLSHTGEYDPRRSHSVPHAIDVTFLTSPMYVSMPETIGFAGTSSTGAFHGRYHPKSGEVETDVEVGGMSLPGVLIKRGNETLHGTGRSRGVLSAEIDGHPADVFYPKARLDD